MAPLFFLLLTLDCFASGEKPFLATLRTALHNAGQDKITAVRESWAFLGLPWSHFLIPNGKPLRFHSRSDDTDWLPNKNKSPRFNVKLVWISWKSDPFNVALISCTHHLPLLKSLGQHDWAVKQRLHLSIKTAPFQAALCCWPGKFSPRYHLWANSTAVWFESPANGE